MYLDSAGYLHCNHSVSRLKAHAVIIPKYRGDVLRFKIKRDAENIISHICAENGLFLEEINSQPEHIHFKFQYPPKVAISDALQWIKGASSRYLRTKYGILKDFCVDALWSGGFFVNSVGMTSEATVDNYIRNQGA